MNDHLHLLLLFVVVRLLLALWYQVIQPGQLFLCEANIQKFSNENQSQDLQGAVESSALA